MDDGEVWIGGDDLVGDAGVNVAGLHLGRFELRRQGAGSRW
jgi:hypothetical protein